MKNLSMIIAMLMFVWAKAQQPFMWQLIDDDGLPSMVVYQVFQDSKGFIWLGTNNGICKYDGNRFTNYVSYSQRGKSFSYIREDGLGRIWTANFTGQVFCIDDDSLKLFEPFEKIYQRDFPTLGTGDKCVYIGTDTFVYQYRVDKNEFSKINIPRLFQTKEIVTLPNGYTVINSDEIVVLRRGKTIFRQKNSYNSIEFDVYSQHLLMYNRMNEKLSMSLLNTNTFQQTPINCEGINAIQKAKITGLKSFKGGDYWLITLNGAYNFNVINNECKNVQVFLPGKAISSIIKDKEGNYWITTLKDGVYIMPSKKIWLLDTKSTSIKGNQISKIEADNNGNLYLANENGNVIEFNKQAKKITQVIELNYLSQDVEMLKYNKHNNTLLAYCNALYELNLKTKTATQVKNISAVKFIDIDYAGNTLISTSTKSTFNPSKNGTSSVYYKQCKKYHKTNKDSVCTFRIQRGVCNHFYNADTSIWIGYIDKLFVYKNGKFNYFKDEIGRMVYATDMVESEDSTLWIGTVQKGLIGYKNGKIAIHLTEQNGLKSNHIKCIDAKNDEVWFATDNGVYHYQKNTGILRNFSKEDGLAANEVFDIYFDRDNVYLATSKGLQWFDTKLELINTYRTPIYINHISINDSVVKLPLLNALSYNQNNIAVSIVGPSFKSRGSLKFAYRLIGLNEKWNFLNSTQQLIRFNSLPSGSYEFQVKAINNDGIESSYLARFPFVITPPYWQTWWFIFTWILALILLVSLVFVYRIQNLKKRNRLETDRAKLLAELRSSQLAALKVQMNPHFIFNALNSIQEFILTNEKRLANTYLGKFSDLMRLYLEMSNKQYVLFDEELKALRLYLDLEAMRFEDNFEYNISIDEKIESDEIRIPAMIIQPFVENSIKHGLLHKRGNKQLNIIFKKGDLQTINCEVIDNGIGRLASAELNKKRSKVHASFATGATQKRLEILNTGSQQQIGLIYFDLKDQSGLAKGTRVIITMPYTTI